MFKHIILYLQNLHHISLKTVLIYTAFVTFHPQFAQQRTEISH